MTIPTYSDFQKQASPPPPRTKADRIAELEAVLEKIRAALADGALVKDATLDTRTALTEVALAKGGDYLASLRGVAPQPRTKSLLETVVELAVEKSRAVDQLADAIAKGAAPLVAAGINKRNELLQKRNELLETATIQLEEIQDELGGVKKEVADNIGAIKAGVAKIAAGQERILAQPGPGRGPMRMDARPSNDADTLRKTAAGAPPAVRDFLLNEAKAIDADDNTRRTQ